jgi:hypothetical protein
MAVVLNVHVAPIPDKVEQTCQGVVLVLGTRGAGKFDGDDILEE